MAILQYNPTSAGRRGGSVGEFRRLVEKGRPQQSGRHPACTFRGGGHKRMYRIIDLGAKKKDGVVDQSRVGSNTIRTARPASRYCTIATHYILSSGRLKADTVTVSSGADVEPLAGNCLRAPKDRHVCARCENAAAARFARGAVRLWPAIRDGRV